jgi:enoyl-CoA hydratase/carnithine racemase
MGAEGLLEGMTGALQITTTDNVCLVINRDASGKGMRPSLTPSYVSKLTDLLQAFRLDPDKAPCAVILSGAEASSSNKFSGEFSAGADLGLLHQAASGHYAARRAPVDGVNALVRAVRSCPCPVIASVDGGAEGAGMALMLACDLIVAERAASFTAGQLPVGLTPSAGLSFLLAAAVPRWLVAELLFTQTPVTAEQLYHSGVINQLTEKGQTLETATALATELGKSSQAGLQATKRLLSQVAYTNFDDQLEAEANTLATALGTDEVQSRLAARLSGEKLENKDRQGG